MKSLPCSGVLDKLGVPAAYINRLSEGDDEILVLGPLSLSIQDGRVCAYDHEADLESDEADLDFTVNIGAYVKALLAVGVRWSFLDQEAPLVALVALNQAGRHEIMA